jgi:hypothetical protein
MPPNQGTTPRPPWTQHAVITAFAIMGGSYEGLRYRPSRVNLFQVHGDLGNSQPIDKDDDLPPLPKRYRLPGIGRDVFRSGHLRTLRSGQYRH